MFFTPGLFDPITITHVTSHVACSHAETYVTATWGEGGSQLMQKLSDCQVSFGHNIALPRKRDHPTWPTRMFLLPRDQ